METLFPPPQRKTEKSGRPRETTPPSTKIYGLVRVVLARKIVITIYIELVRNDYGIIID